MIERRAYKLIRLVSTRAADTGPGQFVGHPAVFNSRTDIGDPMTWGFREEVAPGAFDRALDEEQDVRALVDHNPSMLLGRTASGTLRLAVDKTGLVSENDLPNTSVGRDASVLLDRGDITQMSFAFDVKAQRWEDLPDGTELRTILDVDLYDVSLVTFPAYTETDAALRSSIEQIRSTSPRRHELRAAALERFSKLSPPPGMTKKERTA